MGSREWRGNTEPGRGQRHHKYFSVLSSKSALPVLHCNEGVTGTDVGVGQVKRLSSFWKFCFAQSGRGRVLWGAQARGGGGGGPRGRTSPGGDGTQAVRQIADPGDKVRSREP